MCEMLVCPEDMTADRTRALPLRGDVIAIAEDGHRWGAKESAQFIRVLRPNQPAARFGNLLGSKVPEGHAPIYRAFYLDLVTLEIRRRDTVPLVLEA